MWAIEGKDEMNATGHGAVAEDFIAMMDETGGFNMQLGMKLISRSRELPTDATPDRLLNEVLEDWVRANFAWLSSFRVSRYMQGREVPMIVEALKPLCGRAFVTLNDMLSMDCDHLFPSNAYVQVMGRVYVEDAPSVTFVQFINTAERLKAIHSAKYERFAASVLVSTARTLVTRQRAMVASAVTKAANNCAKARELVALANHATAF